MKWDKPQTVTALEMSFGGKMDKLLPPLSDIPVEFKKPNKWTKIQSKWFYEGLPVGTEFSFKPGIDGNAALRHLKTIQGSFEPKHQHKEAAVAWLMSLWVDEVNFPPKP